MADNLYVRQNLLWDVDGDGDIGDASGTARPDNIHMKGFIEIAEISAPSAALAATNRIYFKSSDHKPYYKDDAGVEHPFGGGPQILWFDSLADPGGAADVDFQVPGLLYSDEILAITQKVRGQADLPILSFHLDPAMRDGHITVHYLGDPVNKPGDGYDPTGGPLVRVLVKRA